MNALTAYERMDDLLSGAMLDVFRRSLLRELPFTRLPGEMKLDVSETDKAYTVKAEIPGAKKEDVQVKIDGNFVTISAEVKEEKSSKDEKARSLIQELYYGSMSRGISLAFEIDEKGAQANFDQGVLMLKLPKRSETSGATLTIQ